jgi:hypothetical protein
MSKLVKLFVKSSSRGRKYDIGGIFRMTALLIEGFDKYQDGRGNGIIPPTLLGEWIGLGGTGGNGFTPGAFSGLALVCGQNNGLNHPLPGNFGTVIFGMRIYVPTFGGGPFGISFMDVSTDQFTVFIDSVGKFEAVRGTAINGSFGTSLATSTASIGNNVWHYLEARVTIDNVAGSYDIYLDGVNILSATGVNTRTTGNSYANAFRFYCTNNIGGTQVDDLYVFDNSTSFNNAVRGDSIVETQWPSSDNTVAFTVGASAFGAYYANVANVNNQGANVLMLRKFAPAENCTINSVSTIPGSTSLSAKFKMVIYSDNSNAPGTLLSSGTEVTGCTAGIVLTGNLVTPQSLTGAVPYWIGWITDTGVNISQEDNTTNHGFVAANTYGSGAPTPNPAMTGLQPSWLIWGNVTSAVNFAELQAAVALPLVNYVVNTSVGDEDLYNFPNLSTTPLTVAAMKVSAFCAKTDAGARTLDLRTKSSGTDDPGDNAGQSVVASFQYLSSIWNTDPHTGLAWSASTINAAKSGMKVAS